MKNPAQVVGDVIYPESDGEPLGETETHRDWIYRLLDILKTRYENQRVCVSGNMFLYFVEGNPRRNICPDVFVVKDCEPRVRETYRLWEEPRAPHVVMELTSNSTRQRDQVFKPNIYAELGVEEYFLYDPLAEYLTPSLQGFRLSGDAYIPIEPDADGSLHCEELELRFRLAGTNLKLFDAVTGEEQRTKAELKDKALEEETKARMVAEAAERREAQAREAAERREVQAREAAEKAHKIAEEKLKLANEKQKALEAEIERLKNREEE